ncbi:hypothetical protein [Halomarina rubra]|uniref:Uncharacterized protein n=1 Tax=Halomarina rubra TaxID=2071873 RepID=A0ABD6B1N2_9EURY|nr:hypothetical protein [Halomarina rubra]
MMQEYADQWQAGEFWDALLGPFVDTLGLPMFALLFFGPLGFAYYNYGGSARITMVLLMICGGLTIALAPPAVARFAVIGLVLALAAVGYIIYTRAVAGR